MNLLKVGASAIREPTSKFRVHIIHSCKTITVPAAFSLGGSASVVRYRLTRGDKTRTFPSQRDLVFHLPRMCRLVVQMTDN